MRHVLAIAIVTPLLVGLRTAEAEIVSVPFSTTVSGFVGVPFGIVPEVGVTTVTGSFSYDTATTPFDGSVINGAVFPATITDGFVLNIAGVAITSSNYLLDAVNDVTNFGGSDIFRAIADTDGHNSMGGDFRVNGIVTPGAAQMGLADTDQTFYLTNAAVDMLPTQVQLDQADLVWGSATDGSAPGGESTNIILLGESPPFQMVVTSGDLTKIDLARDTVLPVAVWANPWISAADVDVSTLLLGDPDLVDAGATPVGAIMSMIKDVNDDGLADLHLQFSIQEMIASGVLTPTTRRLRLTGNLLNGSPIIGLAVPELATWLLASLDVAAYGLRVRARKGDITDIGNK